MPSSQKPAKADKSRDDKSRDTHQKHPVFLIVKAARTRSRVLTTPGRVAGSDIGLEKARARIGELEGVQAEFLREIDAGADGAYTVAVLIQGW